MLQQMQQEESHLTESIHLLQTNEKAHHERLQGLDKEFEARRAILNRNEECLVQGLNEKQMQLSELDAHKTELEQSLKDLVASIQSQQMTHDDLTRQLLLLQQTMKDLQSSHANAVKIAHQEEVGDGQGWELMVDEVENYLCSTLDKLKKAYPDLAVDFGAIERRKVRMTKIQDIIKREGLDGKSGIYRLIRKSDGKVYIGQAVDIKARWYTHIKKMVGAESKGNELIYADRPDNYWWYVVEKVEKNRLNERESWWIDYYASDQVGLNKKSGNKNNN